MKEQKPTVYGKTCESQHGRTTHEVICAFCNQAQIVYAWSFAGCGKKCNCGAKMGRYLTTKETKDAERHQSTNNDTENNEMIPSGIEEKNSGS